MTSLPVIFLFGRHSFERPPPGSDFYALPLPWGALHLRAYACPAWRGMSIAPAGSSSNSVHWKRRRKKKKKKTRTSHSPSVHRGIGGRERGWGGLRRPSYQTLFLCLSLSLTPSPLISVVAHLFFKSFHHLTNRAQTQRSLWLCMTCGREGARSKWSQSRLSRPNFKIQGFSSQYLHCCVAVKALLVEQDAVLHQF